MKDFAKIIVFLFLLLLAISSVNAEELEDIGDGDSVDLEIDESIDSVCPEEEVSDSSLDEGPDENSKDLLREESSICHQVSPSNYTRYFNSKGYVLTDKVSAGDTIDLSGRFSKKNFIFTIPCSVTSSKNDAVLTNCMVEFENVTSSSSCPSFVSNLGFNTSIEKAPCVYILGSSYIDV